MKKIKISQKVKELRIKNGFSQEELAEKTGLCLQSISKIENGEEYPSENCLERLSSVLDVPLGEITDCLKKEKKAVLTNFNLSALFFLIFPLIGIIIQIVLWINKKDKIQELNELGKSLLNFQFTWLILTLIGSTMTFGVSVYAFLMSQGVKTELLGSGSQFTLFFILLMWLFYFISVIVNSIRINKGKTANYYLKIRFLK